MPKTIKITDEDHAILNAVRQPGETFSQAVHRLIVPHNPFKGIDEFMGDPETDPETDPEYLASVQHERSLRQ